MRNTLAASFLLCLLAAGGISPSPAAAGERVNVAAAANGATATASSTDHAGYAPATTINGDRRGASWGNGGGWRDKTPRVFPDWLEIAFPQPSEISEVAVFSLQDAGTASIEPTPAMTFTKYGVVDFTIQYWTGTTWAAVPGGTVVGNSVVWRTVQFPAVTTSRIRILVQKAVDSTSRIVEVEAYAAASGEPPPPDPEPPVRTNVAAASAGAVAAASSTDHAGYAPATAINGDRRGINWGNGGGWRDKTPGSFPDWLEVTFAGPKSVDEVALFSLQDGATSPVEPARTMTFTKYGIRDFTVEYWTGSAWQAAAAVTGNNLVWRSVTFPAVTTTRIRVLVQKAADSTSRIIELEAYSGGGGTPPANVPPTVTLTGPPAGTTVTAPGVLELTATASDTDGSISQVAFRAGTTLLGVDDTAPYAFTWSGIAAGTYTLTATATDNAGASTTSSGVQVTVSSGGGPGTEWFVAAGASGSGSSAAPFGRIQQAVDVAQPGDTITVRPGTYAETITTVRNGAQGLPIRIRAESGRNSVLVTRSGRVLNVSHSDILVEGLVLDGQYGVSDTVKINSGGHRFTLRDSEVRRSTADLIDMSAPHGVLIENSLVHHALNAANGRADAHGIVAGPVHDLTIRNTEIHTFSGDGFQVDPGRSSPGWNNVTIDGCLIWLAPLPSAENGFAAGIVPGENAVDTKSSPSLPRATMTIRNSVMGGFRNGLIGNMAALNLKENVEVRVDRVTVFDSEIAFRLRGPTASTPAGARVTLTNAVIYDVATAFRYENDIERADIWNVTLGLNVGRAFQAASSGMAGLDVRNMLSILPLTAEAADASNTRVDPSAFVNAAADDYRLAAGSPAIDAGVTIPTVSTDRVGTPRPQGSAYDVGAYERRP